jgi:hypothetical protein
MKHRRNGLLVLLLALSTSTALGEPLNEPYRECSQQTLDEANRPRTPWRFARPCATTCGASAQGGYTFPARAWTDGPSRKQQRRGDEQHTV